MLERRRASAGNSQPKKSGRRKLEGSGTGKLERRAIRTTKHSRKVDYGEPRSKRTLAEPMKLCVGQTPTEQGGEN